MELHRGAEQVLKRIAASSLSVALARAQGEAPNPATATRVLLVRIDRRVGEALFMTPLFSALKARRPAAQLHVLVHPSIARVLEGHPDVDRLIHFHAAKVPALRREAYDAVVDCTNWTAPSTTSAIVARLCAPRATVIGPAGHGLERLRDVAVPPRTDTRHEVRQRLHLLSPLGVDAGASPRLSFRPRRTVGPDVARLLEGVRRDGGFAVVNPGGRLGTRRLPPSAFAAAARALVERGRRPIVTWGPNELLLAKEVVAASPGSELAPATTLDELAELMAACQLTVCNNTGPMHLSVAVGAPTLGLFVAIDLERWGHAYPPHRMEDLTEALAAGADLDAKVAKLTADFANGAPKTQRAAGSAESGLASSTSMTGTSSSIA